MLCYVMLSYVMLCYVMLCYAMLCYVMLCYVMLCYVMLCYVMLCYVMVNGTHNISEKAVTPHYTSVSHRPKRGNFQQYCLYKPKSSNSLHLRPFGLL